MMNGRKSDMIKLPQDSYLFGIIFFATCFIAFGALFFSLVMSPVFAVMSAVALLVAARKLGLV